MKKRLLTLLLAVFATSTAFSQSSEIPLKAGDKVTIRIAGVPDNEISQISGVYPVTDAGTIKLPHISAVRAVGVKPSKLQSIIEQTYIGEEIYTRPNVVVSIDGGDATARVVYIISGCARNGPVQYTSSLTMFKAIAAAGSWSTFAKPSKAKLIRNGQTYLYDLSKYSPEVDVKLEPEDQIIVPE